MKKTLHCRTIAVLVALAAFLSFNFSAKAQCPVANSCTPGNAPAANLIFGMGIFNVNVNNGAINNTTLGASQGYQNYSCTIGATITATVGVPISIQTNNNVNENVRVWIDYNNDGIFHATNELAFSSDNQKLHTGTITAPATATLGTPLRMRVSADNFSSPVPTPCSTPVYSQVEDYRITIIASTVAPVAEFTASNTTTCTSSVCFTDLSTNGPTTWLWNFGDPVSGAANTSTLQNPCHSFSAPGIYSVSLTVTNANGSNTVTKSNYITYHNNVPVAATCTPNTANYCCNYGITNVNFGNGLMTNSSANGAAGYQDFTCTKSVTVMAGNIYQIALNTGSNPHDTRVYIDLNNDGSFTGSNEMVLQMLNQTNPTGNISIPGTTFTNTALRMRIISDETGSTFNSCTGIQTGQAEDYTITITPNTNPPVAQFTSNYATACDTTVQFTDQSTNAPTSWLWNFGDPASGTANTSTLPNPVHIYRNAGIYNVTLTATNANGSNTLTKTNYITVIKPCLIYCNSTGHTNNNIHISNVSLGTLNNVSGQAPGGYSNFTSLSANVIRGNPATLSVTRSGALFNSSVSAWIDFNRNGTFEATERVMALNSSNSIATTAFTIPGTAPLGATRMRVITSGLFNAPTNPCLNNQFNMEVEDYTVVIQTNQQPPIVDFSVPNQITCNGIVQFSDNSLNSPTSWLWNFGDAASGASNTSTLQNPAHTFSAPGVYSITLTATNSFGSNTITKTNYITYDPTNTFCTSVTMPASGTGPTATLCTGTIYDPGGQNGPYGNNASGVTTIAPTGAASVTLTFTMVNMESCCDFLRIYDGPTTSSPLLRTITGNSLPIPATVTSSGGALTLQFSSDNSFTGNGFAATWSCTQVTAPPVAQIKADFNDICTGLVRFQDNSTNAPTSWLWNFGHPASGAANTSTLQNPTHTYPTSPAASYTVTLTTTNSFGSHTVTMPNYVNITVPCLTYCASNGHNNTNQWISNVTMGTINNTTTQEANGYGNYTNLTTNVVQGSTTNPLSVTVGSPGNPFAFVSAWIDFNKDGLFQTSERVFNQQVIRTTVGAPFLATGTIAVPNTAVTGTTRMRVIMTTNSNLTSACITNFFNTEVEDYTINIQPNTLPPVAAFTADLTSVCANGLVRFMDNSANGPTTWLWNFGDPASGVNNTSTLQNPTHIYSITTPGTYTVTLTTTNSFGNNTVTRTSFVNITVPCLTYCNSTGHTNTNQWISNVTLGTINNTTGQETNGYGNYTYLNANLLQGATSNPVTVTVGSPANPFAFVSVWIDFNKDGVFQTTERVSNVQALSAGFGLPFVATGNIAVPGNAVAGATRMRVIMTNNNNLTSACITNFFNTEVEDYTVTIQLNTQPPVAMFTSPNRITCNGFVQFTDTSANNPTSWLWNFGDPTSGAANTSTLQNPTHTYAAPGLYSVTLTATNTFGANSITKTGYINYDPTNPFCTAVTMPASGTGPTATLCNGSIYDPGGQNGQYGNNANGVITIAPTGAASVTLTFTMVDMESCCDFLRIYDGPTTSSPLLRTITGNSLPIPATVTSSGGALTLQFSSDNSLTGNGFAATWSCTQVTAPPVAQMKADFTDICTGLVRFQDNSTNAPTSWLWNFGHPASGAANTSTLQNPTHTYPAGTAASYTVTLTTTNGFGSNTVTMPNFVNIAVPCLTYCISNGHNNTNQWMSNVTMGAINNTTTQETNGYGNYTYLNTPLTRGTTGNAFSATIDSPLTPFAFVSVWIDFNKDGVFQTTERVMNVQATRPSVTVPFRASGSITVPATASTGFTRMRVIMSNNSNLLSACFTSLFNTEVEDYSVNIQAPNTPPTALFTVNNQNSCTGTFIFTDGSSNTPTSWTWNFGNGNTSTQQNPTFTYTTPGTYTVTLRACNAYGCDTLVRTSYVTFNPNNPGCNVMNMPNTGQATSTSCAGTLYDDGGAGANYSNNGSGTLTISPAGATRVSMTFSVFDLESCCDLLTIYDGPNTTSPMIGSYSGTTLPSNGNPIHANSGTMTVRFTSNSTVTRPGFAATWSCSTGLGLKPEQHAAAFSVFPNPTTGMVNIKLNEHSAEAYQIQITNVVGEVIMRQNVSFADGKEQPLDMSKLAKGVYFLKIQNSKMSGMRKVVLH